MVLSQKLCDQDPVIWDFPGQKCVKNIINGEMGQQGKAVGCSTWVMVEHYSLQRNSSMWWPVSPAATSLDTELFWFMNVVSRLIQNSCLQHKAPMPLLTRSFKVKLSIRYPCTHTVSFKPTLGSEIRSGNGCLALRRYWKALNCTLHRVNFMVCKLYLSLKRSVLDSFKWFIGHKVCLTKQCFGDINVNETETYGVNFCKIAHDFKN